MRCSRSWTRSRTTPMSWCSLPPTSHRLWTSPLCTEPPPRPLWALAAAGRLCSPAALGLHSDQKHPTLTSRLGADARERACPEHDRDRADLKVYIGPPNTHARYEILKSCLVELQRVGIIKPVRAAVPDPSLSRGRQTVGVPRRHIGGFVDTHTHRLPRFGRTPVRFRLLNVYQRLQEGWELPAFTELQSPMDALSPAAAKEAESPQPSRREGEEDDMCMDHGTPGAASQPSRAQACGAMLLSVAQDIEVRRRRLPTGIGWSP